MNTTRGGMAVDEQPERKKAHPAQLSHIRIEEGEKGGHLVEHHMEHGMHYSEPEKHVFGKEHGKELIAHLVKVLHIKA